MIDATVINDEGTITEVAGYARDTAPEGRAITATIR